MPSPLSAGHGAHRLCRRRWNAVARLPRLLRRETVPLCAQVVFSEAWWVGTREDNPEEKQLPIPPHLELTKLHDEAQCGFAGGCPVQATAHQRNARSEHAGVI